MSSLERHEIYEIYIYISQYVPDILFYIISF